MFGGWVLDHHHFMGLSIEIKILFDVHRYDSDYVLLFFIQLECKID